MDELSEILQAFDPISLMEMDTVSLLNRADTKFIIPESKLPMLLTGLEKDFRVLSVNDHRIISYVSEYFDTKNFKFYNDHHRGKANRNKVRIRHYVESETYFLEVKRKTGRGFTDKSRIPISSFEKDLSHESMTFVNREIGEKHRLVPSLKNSFKRITLVNLREEERVSIDLSLAFRANNESKRFDQLVVVELKQERFSRKSVAFRKLKSMGYNPISLSKYCLGLANLEHGLKHNAFKPKFQRIKKLIAA